MAQPELRRRLSMSSDAQWTNRGRNITSSGYALSPTSANTDEVDPATTTVSPPTSPGSSNASVRTRQLNASSIFARLGLADTSSLPVPAGPLPRSGSSSSSSSSTLNGVRSGSGLPSFSGLKVANDITPTVSDGKEATSYMDASNSDHHLGRERSSADNDTPTKMMPIEADILLPFADRPAEVRELLEDTERNRGLYELLKETFTVRSANNTSTNLTTANLSASPPSSPSVSPAPEDGASSENSSTTLPGKTLNLLRSQEHKRQDSTSTVTPTTPTGDFSSSQSSKKWTFADLQSHLQIPRSMLCDQDWIDILKANVYPRSLLLWERLRACLGVDVDDEQGGDRYEPLSSDIEPPGMDGVGQMSRSASSNNGLDLLLSPRAILSRMASSNSQHNTNDNPPTSALSSVFSSSLDSNAPLHSPSGFSANNNLNTFSFSSPQKASSTQPMSIPNAVQASPSRSPNFSLKELESPSSPSVSRSPVTSTSMAAARNHRRSSSGGSSFRKSFAMSSINEDSPLDNFESRDVAPSSSGLKTPENEIQQQASVNDTVRNDGRVDLGSLLRLKGFGVGDVAPPPSTATSSSMPPFSPQLPSSTGPSSYGVTNSAAPGHLPPPTPLSPTMSMSRSFSSSSLSGVGVPRSPNFSASPFLPSTSSPSSALGLKLANPTNFLGSNASSSNSSSAANSPTKSMQKYRDSRRDSYDEYISVFGGSEEERSVSGASVQSRGQGPHMRFSFGSQDAATPALNGPRGGSGFALAGLQNQNRSTTGAKNPASARVVAVNESGSGNSTPKAR